MNRRMMLIVLVVALLLASFFAYRWRMSESRLHSTLHWTHWPFPAFHDTRLS